MNHVTRARVVTAFALIFGVVVTVGGEADAVPQGLRQAHSGGGSQFAIQYNVKGKCGSPTSTCVNNLAANQLQYDVYAGWVASKAYAGFGAEEICITQAFGISVNLSAWSMTYSSSFKKVQNISSTSQCTEFGDAAWAIGSPIADLKYGFPTAHQESPTSSRNHGAACINANFFGSFVVCAFHLVANKSPLARLQLGDVASHSGAFGSYQIIVGDANLVPKDATSSGLTLNQMISAGYNEADQACAGFPSCSAEQTFDITQADETVKIDYIFAKGYALIPRAQIYAYPSQTDHSEYTAFK